MAVTINASTSAGAVTTADTSGVLQLQTNGTATVTVDTSGNVGVGTASPAAKLDVAKTAVDTISRTNADAAFGDYQSLGAGLLFQQTLSSPYGFALQAANAANTLQFPLLLNPSGGNVGIGTSSPNAKLETLSSTAGAEVSRFEGTYSGSGTVVLSNWRRSGGAVASAMRYNDANNAMEFGTTTSHAQAFITGGTERARIDSSGNLLVGTTTSSARLTVQADGSTVQPVVFNSTTAGTGATSLVRFRRNGSNVGEIEITGSTTTYATSSDYRLKNTIAPMTGALDKVALLKPVTYKWNVDGSDGQGFIAHELQEVVEGCVTGEKDAVDAEGNPQYQGIDTSFLVATLTAAIQELKAIVDAQGAEIAALKGI
jgi:hypothetical protein